MQFALTFRKFSENDQPGEGELWVRSAPRKSGAGLADWVLEDGLGVLQQGPGEPTRLVVQHDPTFDDMLAATIADHLLAKRPLPPGLKGFAIYAGLVREGLQPGQVAFEQSLEGIYLAIRRESGGADGRADLLDPDVAVRFAKGWARMEARILAAAEQGVDPSAQPLFTNMDFARERALLNEDHDVYRQDIQRGERWRVRLPLDNAPPEGAGLLLREPTSKLWKYWSRKDPEAPGGNGYLFWAIFDPDWGWVFSTPRPMKLQLRGLHAALQEAEAKKTPPGTAPGQWFDGDRFDYTMVAPPRGGTRLSEEEVLDVARAWARAEPVVSVEAAVKEPVAASPPPRKPLPQWPLWVAVGAPVAALIVWLSLPRDGIPPPPPPPPPQRDHLLRSVRVSGGGTLRSADGGGTEHAPPQSVFNVERELDLEPGKAASFEVKESNEFKQERAVKLTVQLFPTGQPVAVEMIEVNGKSLSPAEVREAGGSGAALTIQGGENTVRVGLKNQGATALPVTAAISWSDNPKAITLHVLAVGVSEYRDDSLKLKTAHKDAIDIAKAFQEYGKGLFGQVVIHGKDGGSEPLINADATRENVIDALHALKGRVKEHDLLVVFFAGHGEKDQTTGIYYFLPSDYKKDRALEATAVRWDAIKEPMEALRCRAVVILDTCHSGAAGMRGTSSRGELSEAINKAMARFAGTRRGIILLAACLGDQKTADDFGGHGVFTLALLEAIRGQRLGEKADGDPDLPHDTHPDNPVITLQDLQKYADARVNSLVQRQSRNADQGVILRPLGDIAARQIPISLFNAGPPAVRDGRN
jgi:uncharacterized caspase-like protein